MANTKITDMTAITAFADTMQVPIVDDTLATALQNQKFTIAQLKTILGSIDLDNLNADTIEDKAGTSYPDFTYGFKNTGLFSNLPIDTLRKGGTLQKRVALTDATLTSILTLTRTGNNTAIGANVTVLVTNGEVLGADSSSSLHKFFVTFATDNSTGSDGDVNTLHNGTVSAPTPATSTHAFTAVGVTVSSTSCILKLNITAGGSSPFGSFAYLFVEWFGYNSGAIANISVT